MEKRMIAFNTEKQESCLSEGEKILRMTAETLLENYSFSLGRQPIK